MDKLAFSVLNKYLLTINYVLYNCIHDYREYQVIGTDFQQVDF